MEAMGQVQSTCYRFSDEPLYKTRYPDSFNVLPHHGPPMKTTLAQANPPELASVDWRLRTGHWHTSSGLAHGNKIPDRFTPSLMAKAPSCMVMHRIFPNVQEQMKTTSQRLMYGPNPVYNTVTKTDFVARRAIPDFDYQNGPLVNIPKRYIRVTRKTMSRPKFDLDVMYSIARKFHPYLSVTKFDYKDPTMDKDKYDNGFCSI